MLITDELKRNFSFYNQVMLTCSFILGIAYLCGYWSVFDINIFPFLSLFDLIRFSAYPVLILYVPFLLFQWLVAELHFSTYIEKKSKKLSSYFKSHPSRLVKVMFPLAAIGYFVFIIWLGCYLEKVTLKIGVPIASIITIAWLSNAVKKTESQQDVVMFHRVGRTLLFLCLLPFISYDYGHHKAIAILKDKEYSYIVATQGDKKEVYKFLGYLDNHYFFMAKKNKTLLINNNMNSLELRHFLKHGESDSPDIGFT